MSFENCLYSAWLLRSFFIKNLTLLAHVGAESVKSFRYFKNFNFTGPLQTPLQLQALKDDVVASHTTSCNKEVQKKPLYFSFLLESA